MLDHDILAKLNRLLIVTPETQLTVAPPISRRTLIATVTEIRTLRERVKRLEAQMQACAGDDGSK